MLRFDHFLPFQRDVNSHWIYSLMLNFWTQNCQIFRQNGISFSKGNKHIIPLKFPKNNFLLKLSRIIRFILRIEMTSDNIEFLQMFLINTFLVNTVHSWGKKIGSWRKIKKIGNVIRSRLMRIWHYCNTNRKSPIYTTFCRFHLYFH